MAKLDENGHEILDPTPIAVPVKFRAVSQYDHIREFIRRELSQQARDQGAESFEEADDFEVGDDFDPTSPWELTFDQLSAPTKFEEERPADQTPTPDGIRGAVPDEGGAGSQA